MIYKITIPKCKICGAEMQCIDISPTSEKWECIICDRPINNWAYLYKCLAKLDLDYGRSLGDTR